MDDIWYYAVSYTHLDVYKRQGLDEEAKGLESELERRHATAADSVLAMTAETD